MQAVPVALMRAAKHARELAEQTGTAFVVMRDGKLVSEVPQPSKNDNSASRNQP